MTVMLQRKGYIDHDHLRLAVPNEVLLFLSALLFTTSLVPVFHSTPLDSQHEFQPITRSGRALIPAESGHGVDADWFMDVPAQPRGGEAIKEEVSEYKQCSTQSRYPRLGHHLYYMR